MNKFELLTNKEIRPEEIAELMDFVGWGRKEEYVLSDIKRSLRSFPFVAHIRSADNKLAGYVSAFSDESFSTFVSELVVHPDCQNQGLGSELLQTVERKYPNVPIYIKPFEDTKEFFLKHGYTEPKRKMSVVSKRNRA